MGNRWIAHSDFTLPYYTSGFIRNTPHKKLIYPFFMSEDSIPQESPRYWG